MTAWTARVIGLLVIVLILLSIVKSAAAMDLPFKYYAEIPHADMETIFCMDEGGAPVEKIRHGTFFVGHQIWMIFSTPGRFLIRRSDIGWLGHYGRDGELEVGRTVEEQELGDPCFLFFGPGGRIS